MEFDIADYLPLVREVEANVGRAIREGLHISDPTKERSRILLALAVQSGEHMRAVRILFENALPTQALATCRTLVEIMALATGIARDEALLKLFEKKSLEGLRKKLADLNMSNQVGGLDETIESIHSGATSALAMDQLLGIYESKIMGKKGRTFYVGYRQLCDYTHPEFWSLSRAVESLDGKSGTIKAHNLDHAREGLALGLIAAISTISACDTPEAGIQVNPELAKEFVPLIHRAFDIMGSADE